MTENTRVQRRAGCETQMATTNSLKARPFRLVQRECCRYADRSIFLKMGKPWVLKLTVFYVSDPSLSL